MPVPTPAAWYSIPFCSDQRSVGAARRATEAVAENLCERVKLGPG
jgi:hypothetical protein